MATNCLRDLESTSAGCQGAQGLYRSCGVAVSPDGKQVYVASAVDDTLTTFARNTQTGALTWIGCLRNAGLAAGGCSRVDGLDGARGIAISGDGASIYVGAADGDALAVFDRDAAGAATWADCFRDSVRRSPIVKHLGVAASADRPGSHPAVAPAVVYVERTGSYSSVVVSANRP